MRALAEELLEKDTTTLDKICIVVISHLHVLHIDSVGNLLRNGRDVAARPALSQLSLQGLKLVESALASPLALLVTAGDGVLHDLADLDGVTYGEDSSVLLLLVLVVLKGTLSLLTLRVERHDLLDQISLRIVGAYHQVLCTSGTIVLSLIRAAIDVVTHGCRGFRHGDGSLAHEVSALSSEAKRHTLLGIWVVCGSLLNRHLLRTVFFLLTAEQVLFLLLGLRSLLSVGVGGLLHLLLLLSGVGVGRLFLLLHLLLLLLGLDYSTIKGSPILS